MVSIQQSDEAEQEFITNWIGRLNIADEAGRQAAAQTLVQAGSAALNDLYVTLVMGAAPARESAAWALGQLGGPEAVTALCDALHDSVEAVRISAARALGEIGDSRALFPLELTAMRDSQVTVRYVAEQSISRLKESTRQQPG